MTPDQLLDLLANEGGNIVRTASLNSAEIAAARIEGRMVVREDGCGFVHIPERATAGNAVPTDRVKRALEAALILCDTNAQRAYFKAEIDSLASNAAPEKETPAICSSRASSGRNHIDEDASASSLNDRDLAGNAAPELPPAAGVMEIVADDARMKCVDGYTAEQMHEFRASNAATAAPGDLSKRLRESATAEVGYPHARLLITAADELDRLASNAGAAPLVWLEECGEVGGYWSEQAERDCKEGGQQYRAVVVVFDSASPTPQAT